MSKSKQDGFLFVLKDNKKKDNYVRDIEQIKGGYRIQGKNNLGFPGTLEIYDNGTTRQTGCYENDFSGIVSAIKTKKQKIIDSHTEYLKEKEAYEKTAEKLSFITGYPGWRAVYQIEDGKKGDWSIAYNVSSVLYTKRNLHSNILLEVSYNCLVRAKKYQVQSEKASIGNDEILFIKNEHLHLIEDITSKQMVDIIKRNYLGDGKQGNPKNEKKDKLFNDAEVLENIEKVLANLPAKEQLSVLNTLFEIILSNEDKLYTPSNPLITTLTNTQMLHIDVLKNMYVKVVEKYKKDSEVKSIVTEDLGNNSSLVNYKTTTLDRWSGSESNTHTRITNVYKNEVENLKSASKANPDNEIELGVRRNSSSKS